MMSYFNSFRQLLGKYPLVNNMVVCSGLYYAGDISRQTIQRTETYETTNSARMAVFGGCAAAPFMYYWYKFLDAKIPGVSSKVIIAKVIVDQAVAGFALLNIFYVSMSLMEGKKDILQEAKEKVPRTYLVSCCFWPVAQVVNFAFLPTHLRTVYVAGCSFIWTNILSFFKAQPVTDLQTVDTGSKQA